MAKYFSGSALGTSIATAEIDDLAVTTAKLAADAVTNAKMADDAITNTEVSATANIAVSKIADLQQNFTSTETNFNTTSTTFVDITGMSVTFTAVAGDHLITCQVPCSHGTADNYVITALDIDGTDATNNSTYSPAADTSAISNTSIIWSTNLTAASHTIKLQGRVAAGTGYWATTGRFMTMAITKVT